MNNANKKDEGFWMEQHSWGDFPFDKPCLNLTPLSFNATGNKKRVENTLKHVSMLVKALFNLDDSKDRIRYPLI